MYCKEWGRMDIHSAEEELNKILINTNKNSHTHNTFQNSYREPVIRSATDIRENKM